MADNETSIPAPETGGVQKVEIIADPSQKSRTPEGDERWAAEELRARRMGYENTTTPEQYVGEARNADWRDTDPHYRNSEEAHQHRMDERRRREAAAAYDRQTEKLAQEAKLQAEIQAAQTWSEPEAQIINELQGRALVNRQAAEVLGAALPEFYKDLPEIERRNRICGAAEGQGKLVRATDTRRE